MVIDEKYINNYSESDMIHNLFVQRWNNMTYEECMRNLWMDIKDSDDITGQNYNYNKPDEDEVRCER